jgi:hypothetical protein
MTEQVAEAMAKYLLSLKVEDSHEIGSLLCTTAKLRHLETIVDAARVRIAEILMQTPRIIT